MTRNDFLRKDNFKYTPLSEKKIQDLLILCGYFIFSVAFIVFYHLFTNSHAQRNITSNIYMSEIYTS